jgi:hypothetical protein
VVQYLILVNYRIIIGDTSVFVDKVQSLSRVTSGETGAAWGAAGTNGSNGLKTTTGYLYYQLSQLNAPATLVQVHILFFHLDL